MYVCLFSCVLTDKQNVYSHIYEILEHEFLMIHGRLGKKGSQSQHCIVCRNVRVSNQEEAFPQALTLLIQSLQTLL